MLQICYWLIFLMSWLDIFMLQGANHDAGFVFRIKMANEGVKRSQQRVYLPSKSTVGDLIRVTRNRLSLPHSQYPTLHIIDPDGTMVFNGHAMGQSLSGHLHHRGDTPLLYDDH